MADSHWERIEALFDQALALDHPNICTIYDIGESDDGELYIAMAYYQGESSSGAGRSTTAPTCGRWAWCSTRCSPAVCLSAAST